MFACGLRLAKLEEHCADLIDPFGFAASIAQAAFEFEVAAEGIEAFLRMLTQGGRVEQQGVEAVESARVALLAQWRQQSHQQGEFSLGLFDEGKGGGELVQPCVEPVGGRQVAAAEEVFEALAQGAEVALGSGELEAQQGEWACLLGGGSLERAVVLLRFDEVIRGEGFFGGFEQALRGVGRWRGPRGRRCDTLGRPAWRRASWE